MSATEVCLVCGRYLVRQSPTYSYCPAEGNLAHIEAARGLRTTPAHPVRGEARAEGGEMDTMTKLLYSTDDAMVWAEQFCSLFTVTKKDGTGDGDNVGLMVGWFANAIETAKSLRDAHTALAAAEVEQLKARDLPFELRWSPGGGWCVGWATGQPGRWQSAEHAPTLGDAIRNALNDARLTEHEAEGTL